MDIQEVVKGTQEELTNWLQKRNALIRKSVWSKDGVYFRDFLLENMSEEEKESFLKAPYAVQVEISLRTACKCCYNLSCFGSGDKLRAEEVLKAHGSTTDVDFEPGTRL